MCFTLPFKPYVEYLMRRLSFRILFNELESAGGPARGRATQNQRNERKECVRLTEATDLVVPS
jgi:hypothetical protein